MKHLAIALISLTFFYVQASAQESDVDQLFVTPPMKAVEQRAYQVDQEIIVNIGVAPLDAFNKSFLAGLTYHKTFGDIWGWEVINAQAASNSNTGLKKDLLDNFGVEPEGILDFITTIFSTGVTYTPIYAKNLWFNKSVVYGELTFVGAAGAVTFDSGDSAPMVGIGVIPRFYINKRHSFKTDIRLNYHMGEGKSSNALLTINFGWAVHF
ncbi:MAG: hypothetical protein R2827_15950 [Bdellovibrionales bacterium]